MKEVFKIINKKVQHQRGYLRDKQVAAQEDISLELSDLQKWSFPSIIKSLDEQVKKISYKPKKIDRYTKLFKSRMKRRTLVATLNQLPVKHAQWLAQMSERAQRPKRRGRSATHNVRSKRAKGKRRHIHGSSSQGSDSDHETDESQSASARRKEKKKK